MVTELWPPQSTTYAVVVVFVSFLSLKVGLRQKVNHKMVEGVGRVRKTGGFERICMSKVKTPLDGVVDLLSSL